MTRFAFGAKCGFFGRSGFKSPANSLSFSNEAKAKPPIPTALFPKKWRRVRACKLGETGLCDSQFIAGYFVESRKSKVERSSGCRIVVPTHSQVFAASTQTSGRSEALLPNGASYRQST